MNAFRSFQPALRLLRFKQWSKNAFVIAPIFFAQQFNQPSAWLAVIMAAIAFGFISSATYIMNDAIDRKEDQRHPIKSQRPLASGSISLPIAALLALFCLGASAGLLYALPSGCAVIAMLYLAGNIAYSLWLKHEALLDVFFIASCFVLRVWMGCLALAVTVSPWIILTTFMLALFLGFGKRYHELGIADYAAYKNNLQHYNRELLDKLVLISAASALVCYAIYTVEIATRSAHLGMVYTVAFVAFGIFRYLQALYVFGKGGEPETVLMHDRWQWLNLLCWLLATLMLGYH